MGISLTRYPHDLAAHPDAAAASNTEAAGRRWAPALLGALAIGMLALADRIDDIPLMPHDHLVRVLAQAALIASSVVPAALGGGIAYMNAVSGEAH